MKIIKIIFIVFCSMILIVSTGVFLLFQTFDTDQYLPKISQKVSLLLGRQVSVGGVGLGLSWHGITLDAGPLIIPDDPSFTAQPFINITRIRVSLDLRSLIIDRKIRVTGILLQSPQIHFIRNQEGEFNVHSLGRAVPLASSAIVSNQDVGTNFASIVEKSHAVVNASPKNETISITIQDASMSLIDQAQDNPLDVWLTHINASLVDFSFSKPFQLVFEASPLIFKSTSLQLPDNPVFKNISAGIQLNLSRLAKGDLGNWDINGNVAVSGGVIKNFNIVNEVLSHALGSFGGIESVLGQVLNGPLKDQLGREDTLINNARVQFSVHDKMVRITDSSIQTDILELKAKGSIDQGFNADMQTSLHLNQDVSQAMLKELEGLKYLCDDSKRITINGSLNGVIPHLKYKPNKDFKKKSKKFLLQEGGNILGILLGQGHS